jgi:hypothetical protein
VITVGSPPEARIDTSSTDWRVGDVVSFSGHGSDRQDGTLPASRLSWELVMMHCPSSCHAHSIQTWQGVTGSSFVAPDHEYPSHLELRLTATDWSGLSTTETRRLDPVTTTLTVQTVPAGLQVGVGPATGTTPFTQTVIAGTALSLTAPTTQSVDGVDTRSASGRTAAPPATTSLRARARRP